MLPISTCIVLQIRMNEMRIIYDCARLSMWRYCNRKCEFMTEKLQLMWHRICPSFGWGRKQRSYTDQRQQPVNPSVVTYIKQAVTQYRLSTVTQLLFLASIYVDAFTKLGRNAPQAHIVQETDPSSPRLRCMVSDREMTVSTRSRLTTLCLLI